MLADNHRLVDNYPIMSAEFHDTVPDPTEDGFADDLIAVYGDGGAYEIVDSLLSSIDNALENIPLVRQPDLTIQFSFDQDPFGNKTPDRLRAYVDSPKEKITVVLGTAALSGEIAYLLFDTMHHEVGHIAHYQHSEDRDAFDESPFGAACAEGIANLAADKDFGAYVYSNDLTSDKATEIARRELDKTLSGFYHETGYYEFLFGDEQLQNRGYFIGSYVVSNLASYENVSLVEIMQSPLKRFRDFAKAELL
jgi:hypothetical protein